MLRKLLKGRPRLFRKGDLVTFFPSMAYRPRENDEWTVQFHGWIRRPKYNPLATRPFFEALGLKEEWRSMKRPIFEERLTPFLADNKRNKELTVQLGELNIRLRRSAPNGHFQQCITISDEDMRAARGLTGESHRVSYSFATQRGEIHLIPERGLSVISDVDDTLKISEVYDRQLLLRNTFFRPFEAVPGMAALFRGWKHALFHYVSAMPWQLYGCLKKFLDENGFPSGTFHLKIFRLKDRTRLNLLKPAQRYKPSAIRPLLELFPRRQFVLVGDSAERDPEIYAELARVFPNITKIVIREVSEEIQKERYRLAFLGLPRNLWQVFKKPAEIESVPTL